MSPADPGSVAPVRTSVSFHPRASVDDRFRTLYALVTPGVRVNLLFYDHGAPTMRYATVLAVEAGHLQVHTHYDFRIKFVDLISVGIGDGNAEDFPL